MLALSNNTPDSVRQLCFVDEANLTDRNHVSLLCVVLILSEEGQRRKMLLSLCNFRSARKLLIPLADRAKHFWICSIQMRSGSPLDKAARSEAALDDTNFKQ